MKADGARLFFVDGIVCKTPEEAAALAKARKKMDFSAFYDRFLYGIVREYANGKISRRRFALEWKLALEEHGFGAA